MSSSIDFWDEVWDAYEARQDQAPPRRMPVPLPDTALPDTALPPASLRHGSLPAALPAVVARPVAWEGGEPPSTTSSPGHPRPAAAAAPRRTATPLRWWVLLVALMFGLGCVAGSNWPVLRLYGMVLRQDTLALLRQVDLEPAEAGLRQALRAHAGVQALPAGSGAARLLAGMADDMAEGLAAPGALAQLVLARQGGTRLQHELSLAPPWALRLAGRGGLSIDLGDDSGRGGFGLDLVWRGQGWQASAVTLLDPPVTQGVAEVRTPGAQAAGIPLTGTRLPG